VGEGDRSPRMTPVSDRFPRGGRKVRTGKGTVVGNANPARAEGKCHRKDTAVETQKYGKFETLKHREKNDKLSYSMLLVSAFLRFCGKGEMVR